MPTAGLRTLLSGIIDYAGLFPPAKLPLDESFRNYARYRAEPEAWMLGQFICPAARLSELGGLGSFWEPMRDGGPFAISALGRGGANRTEFLNGIREDLSAIQEFRSRFGERATVSAYETKLPPDLVSTEGTIQVDVGCLAAAADMVGEAGMTPYFEWGTTGRWRETWRVLAAAKPRGHCGLKLRCGGLEPAAFPTTEQVAGVIAICHDAGAPLKFTAGLHHPIRHFAAEVQCKMHGFLNVFVAAVLAHARNLPESDVRAIVGSEDAAEFRFDESGLGWRDWRANLDEIETARRQFAVAFGSCSFDEPRDDLWRL